MCGGWAVCTRGSDRGVRRQRKGWIRDRYQAGGEAGCKRQRCRNLAAEEKLRKGLAGEEGGIRKDQLHLTGNLTGYIVYAGGIRLIAPTEQRRLEAAAEARRISDEAQKDARLRREIAGDKREAATSLRRKARSISVGQRLAERRHRQSSKSRRKEPQSESACASSDGDSEV